MPDSAVFRLFLANLAQPWTYAVLLMIATSLIRRNPAIRRDDFLTTMGFIAASVTTIPLHLWLIRYSGSVDSSLWRIDESLGWHHAWLFMKLVPHPKIGEFLHVAYNALPIAVAVAWITERSPVLRRAFLIGGMLVWILYALFPAAGPIYYLTGTTLSAPRNAMPCMHLGFALMLALNSRRVWWRVGWWIYVGVTVLATLGLGEHYLVDLMVAVPYTLGVQWVSKRLLWRNLVRRVVRVPVAQAVDQGDDAIWR